jgi:hypothetical protein
METGSASKSDRFLLDNVQTVPADLKKEKLDNKKVRVLIPTFNSETQIKITGLTAKIPAEVFAVSEGLLKASVVKPAASQDTAAEIPGEDSYD